MTINKNIKTIAKTDEIIKKLDKLNKDKSPKEKSPIKGYRAAAYQTGDTSKGTGSGGNGPPADGVDGTGATVAPDQVNTTNSPTSNTQSTTTSNTDKGLSFSNTYGVGATQQSLAGKNSDMSGATSTPLTGGSAIKTYAYEGASETDLQATLTAIDGMSGLTSDEKTQLKDLARRKWMIENGKVIPGMFSARDIMDGKPYVPKPLNNGTASSVWTSYPGGVPGKGSINQVIGFDVDGNTAASGDVYAVMFNLDKNASYDNGYTKYPTPTQADMQAINGGDGGQAGIWSDPDTGVYYGWELGYYWTVSSPAAAEGATPEQAIHAAIAAVRAAFPASYPTGYGDAYWDTATLSQADATHWDFTWYQGPGAPPNNVQATRASCPGALGSSCPSTQPTYTNWPTTETYVLSFLEGLYQGNIYDGEVPLKWAVGSSIIEMAFGDGTTIIDGRKLRIEPAFNGGTILIEKTSGDSFTKAILLDSNNVPIAQTSTEGDVSFWRPLGAS